MSQYALLHLDVDSKCALVSNVAAVGYETVSWDGGSIKYYFVKVLSHKFEIIGFVGSGGSVVEGVGVKMVRDIMDVGQIEIFCFVYSEAVLMTL